MATNVELRVKMLIAEQFGLDESALNLDDNIQDDLGADSLDEVELVMGIEEEFEIELADEDAEKVTTIAEAIALVERTV